MNGQQTQYRVFRQVEDLYSEMVGALRGAERRISMMYFTFDHGDWSGRMAAVLAERAAAGVEVRLMVDGFGLALDAPRNTFRNLKLLADLDRSGVRVVRFHPSGNRLGVANRLHTKICAIDEDLAFVGGSNIGDHYVGWEDCNLRMSGEIGPAFHDLFEYLRSNSMGAQPDGGPELRLSRLFAGSAQVYLTVPKQRYDIRRALLDLILSAEESIHIRSWYFLPDREILYALRSQAEHGVEVNVLLSHRTRVPAIDRANHIHIHKLVTSGGRVFRYRGRYMHAKVAWNDQGTVLFGSANLDAQAMKGNFECSLVVCDLGLARRLEAVFEADTSRSQYQTPDSFRRRSFSTKVLALACSAASPWL